MKTKHSTELYKKIDLLTEQVFSCQDAISVPDKSDFDDFNGVYNIECATLFADFAGITDLVDQHDHIFSSWLLKVYLTCASSIISRSGGAITAFEGDGLMGLFTGNSKECDAVQCAFQIQWAVSNIVQPKLDALFPEKKYKMSQVVGIDTSKLTAVKTDVWDHYDILWVGRAANYAANLTRINHHKYSTYITSDVYAKLSAELQGSKSNSIWNMMQKKMNNLDVYRSCETIPL